MNNTATLSEALAVDLTSLAERHGLSVFVEAGEAGDIQYHLLAEQSAFRRLLETWTPALRPH
jgi:hypothetical protein